ncbi:MAG TPA: chromosome segregation protein SMC [Chloroflexia bacterium]|nr:chromosome segregation protein SMC [Chloroflexia bacterium]
MRLKHLTIQGFKTFAPRTDLLFGDGLAAIVGPNGSGKSNVADAVRWVLGEQSLTHLRAKRTEDLIFAGSSNRAPLGMAEVSITLDNSDRLLPIDFGEVTLTRRAYRSGENEYYLNKSRVRLREILDVASSLGQAYTVVGQGLVDAALSLRPEERRELFEEAAAIRGYFVQRADALRRLQKTEENVTRVNDLAAELEPQVRRLERQARQAQEYGKLEQELKQLLRLWYSGRWVLAMGALEKSRGTEAEKGRQVDARKSTVTSANEELTRVRAKVWQAVEAVSNLHETRAQSQARHAAQVQAQAVTTERLAAAGQARRALMKEQDEIEVALNKAAARIAELADEIGGYTQELDQLQAGGQAVHSRLDELEADLAKAQAAFDRESQILDTIKRRQSDLQSRIAEAERSRAEKERVAADADSALTSLQRRVGEAETVLESRHSAQAKAQLEVADAERDHTSAAGQLAEARRVLSTAENDRREASKRVDRLASQLSVLAGEQQAGLHGGVRAVVSAVRAGRIHGIVGTVAELLNVPPDLEGAIEAAVGGRLQDIVVETWADAEAAIGYLKQQGAGRATFLPLDTLRAAAPLSPPRGEGIVGRALDLVQYEPRLTAVAESLLGRLLIVEDLPSARRILGVMQTGAPWTLATLGGEVARPGGSVTGGSNARADDRTAKGNTLLARERRRRELQNTLELARKQVSDLERAQELALMAVQDRESTIEKAAGALAEARKGQSLAQMQLMEQQSVFARLQQEHSWRMGLLAETRKEIDALNQAATSMRQGLEVVDSQLGPQTEKVEDASRYLSTQREARAEVERATSAGKTRAAVLNEALRNSMARELEAKRDVGQLDSRRAQIAVLLETAAQDEAALQEGLEQFKAEAENLARQVAEIEAQMAPSERQVRVLEGEISAMEGRLSSLQAELLESETAYSRAAVESQRCLGLLQSLRIEITEELGDHADGAADFVATNETESQLEAPAELGELDGSVAPSQEENAERERRVYALRSRLARIGPVNPLATDEHRMLSERHAYLQTQLDDLMLAGDGLQKVIAELDRTMRDQFVATFAQVNEEFGRFFGTLFGGGTARLELTNPDDVAQSGVDIMAQPPGKRLQPLAALSGGERALTAAALLFALLKVRPVPFCVLDEVDAALDESNVSRFRSALLELGENTQFVVITHNRGTIEAANTLYGVSMAGDGTSQLLSLRVEARAST